MQKIGLVQDVTSRLFFSAWEDVTVASHCRKPLGVGWGLQRCGWGRKTWQAFKRGSATALSTLFFRLVVRKTGKFDTATPAELKQTKAGCLVIRATEYEAEIIAKNNPDIFVESDVIHEKY